MINVKAIKPMFTALVTTMERYGADELQGSIIDPSKMSGALKEYQKVVAIGSSVRDIAVGDLVKINPIKYAVYKDKRKNSVVNNLEEYHNEIVGYDFPQIELDSVAHLLLQDRDIEFVVTDYEDVKPQSNIIHTERKIVLP